ncbi:alpha/beta hydrolase [Streptomyces sp. ALI-76-A]|uniref:alpha/beta hydrolase n=1 Tax=Streptomyces sp. ALI-76-A TaxID=3025736 RepID=UPI00256EB45C|nr:alpha/beta hydrolase [Streptomyces sp. ALI-76-A]MDL5198831.1 alpha/beta hydrolase [Streptomyces sp. ALI-76-A]
MALSLDPEVAQAPAPMAGARADATPPAVGNIAARRAMWEPIIGAAGTAQPIPADVQTSEHHATADDGAQIKLRWYTKDGAAPGPAVLFFHGGGYIFGHIDLFDGPVSRYVSASGVPMLSVEYRRAPEHPFPTPLEDACTALRWLHAHAAELGVDPDRIGVMGDSAGGGIAAAVSILARERGGPQIARQILIMPMLDDPTTTPDPHIAPYPLWSYDDSLTAWPALLGEAAGGPDVPATAAPARLEDATGLPPAYIEVGQLDVFRDEDTAYATKLSRAGVPVECHCTPAPRTSSTPSPSPPTSPAAPSPTASASSNRSEPAPSALTPCRRRGVQALHTGSPSPRCPPRWGPLDTGKNTLKHRAAGSDSHFGQQAHRRPGDCRTA